MELVIAGHWKAKGGQGKAEEGRKNDPAEW